MRRTISILCTLGQLALTGPAIAQSFGIGLSNGPVSLSVTTGPRPARRCEIVIVPTGGSVQVRRGMEVTAIACTDTSCARQEVTLCPTRR